MRYEVELENGQEVSRSLKETKILKEKKDQVVAIGALTTVSRGGKQFSPKKVLNNVKLTAYGAGPASTGKSPGHPLYGITATGTRVQEGRTIAVDPKVIPLGSWVYIEGYGFRRAEDTGSAIKNNIIDIYFEDDKKAAAFGVKRSPKVYVLGTQSTKISVNNGCVSLEAQRFSLEEDIMIKEVIVVEGRSDTVAVKSAVEADTIETGGSAIPDYVLKRIKLAHQKRGVIIFTDPDYPGERIRKIVSQAVPGCKHAFITQDEGRGKRNLGVENATPDTIRKALQNVYTHFRNLMRRRLASKTL